jgi:cation transport regulator ChaC
MSEGDVVQGVVYRLNNEDEAALDMAEGVHKGTYRKEVLPVRVEHTNDYRCMVYVDPVVAEGEPKGEYVVRINRAVADAALPDEYVERHIRKFVPSS